MINHFASIEFINFKISNDVKNRSDIDNHAAVQCRWLVIHDIPYHGSRDMGCREPTNAGCATNMSFKINAMRRATGSCPCAFLLERGCTTCTSLEGTFSGSFPSRQHAALKSVLCKNCKGIGQYVGTALKELGADLPLVTKGASRRVRLGISLSHARMSAARESRLAEPGNMVAGKYL